MFDLWVNIAIHVEQLWKEVRESFRDLLPYNYEKFSSDLTINKHFYSTSILGDGSRYTGQFREWEDVKEGLGQLVFSDGTLFEGMFEDNQPVYGRYILKSGDVYEGRNSDLNLHF